MEREGERLVEGLGVRGWHSKVDVRLPGKGNSNSHGARPVHLIITMIKRMRTSRSSIKNSLSRGWQDRAVVGGDRPPVHSPPPSCETVTSIRHTHPCSGGIIGFST